MNVNIKALPFSPIFGAGKKLRSAACSCPRPNNLASEFWVSFDRTARVITIE